MWKDLSKRFYLGLLLLLFFLLLGLAGTAWGQEPQSGSMNKSSPPPAPSTPKLYENTNNASEDMLTLWEQLKAELTQSERDWQTLQNLLQQLQTEVDGLQSSLTELTERYEMLRDSAKQSIQSLQLLAENERVERLKIEKGRDAWRTTALISGGITLAGVITGILVITLR